MFKKVLIANRGLIQANCVRAVRELGAEAITIYDNEDRYSTGVRIANEAFEIKGNQPGNGYLNIEEIVKLAQEQHVDAVHPGYGFLAQSQDLISELKKCGITTIAPTMDGEGSLADKNQLKKLAMELGLPILPGSGLCGTYAELKEASLKLGFPLVIKSSHGFGGKGMRLVQSEAQLEKTYEYIINQCKKLKLNTHEVYVEKFLTHGHHIEFPVLRDHQGNVVVLPEQECSVQRRFQKLLVESPSAFISRNLRNKLEAVIPSLANRLSVLGFASVEFLVDGEQAYFLEVNGYIQPSHTATSMLTGIDLLKEQIRLFAGETLRFQNTDINRRGHVISAYIAAEDPDMDFAPCPGKVERMFLPFGEGVVVQSMVSNGDQVSTFYDPMIAKIIVRETDRVQALAKIRVAMDELFIDGIRTNIPLMRSILNSREFEMGEIDVSFISHKPNREKLYSEYQNADHDEIASIVAALALHRDSNNLQILESAKRNSDSSVWNAASRWLNRKKMEY